MPVNGAIDIPLQLFGGLVSDLSATDLPPGVSPDCQDVEFLVGGVRTRGGIGPGVFPAISGSVNYMKTYITQQEQLRLLVLDSLGNLYKETSPLVLANFASNITAPYAKSTTIFGREYIGFNDGTSGLFLPMQYDDTNLDRVSQVGPGQAPTVVDAPPEVPLTIVAAPTGAIRFGSVVTVMTTVPHGYNVGETVTLAGVGDASMDGVFLIVSVPNPTTFTFTQNAANSASGGGTVVLTPQIVAGLRNYSVLFVTRSAFGDGQGYFTSPAPPISTWTPAGGLRASVTNIPIGPVAVVARILCFSLAGGGSLYYVPNSSMVILDNTTTTALIDFSETQLTAGINVTTNFAPLLELGEVAGFIDYNNRLFSWGERNKIQNLVNMSFDGGFDAAGIVPLGWTLDPANGSGGSQEALDVVWGFAYKITGNGIAGNRGWITQPAYKDINSVSIIQPNTNYSARVRLKRGGLNAFNQGSFFVQLSSASTGFLIVNFIIVSAMSNVYQEFVIPLGMTPAVIPTDLIVTIGASGTLPATGFILSDCVELFPVNQPVNLTLVRASRSQDPESYDGINGFLNIAESNGQAVRSAFKLRGNLYFVKERSFYVTSDDGANEPALWNVDEVSATVGTYSVNGTDVGDDWAVIADRNGLFIYDGSSVNKVSQEVTDANGLPITAYWNNVNWTFGYKLWVKVDKRNKRILVGLPMGETNKPNIILVLDYRGCSTGADIADSPGVRISSYTGKLIAMDKGRKWCPWKITANSACIANRFDGTDQLFLGNGVNNGKIYNPSNTHTDDDGQPINSYYTTSFFLHHDEEQALQLGSHRKLFSYLTLLSDGNGTLTVDAIYPGNWLEQLVATFTLPGSAINIATITRTANIVSVMTATPHGLPNGKTVVIQGVNDPTFWGVYSIWVLSANTFTYQQIGQPDAVGAFGNVTIATRDLETLTQIVNERIAYKVGTAAIGEFFKLEKFVPSVEPDPWSPISGTV